MTLPDFDHERPELKRTIIFGEEPELDECPIEAANGRLIPGHDYSVREFEKLRALSDGETSTTTPLPTTRQLGRITLNNVTGCWELPVYNDQKNRARYGQMSIADIGKGTLAHRVMYHVFFGLDTPMPDELLDHLCENKACCYPRHLEPVSYTTNTRRGIHAKRFSPGQLSIFEV